MPEPLWKAKSKGNGLSNPVGGGGWILRQPGIQNVALKKLIVIIRNKGQSRQISKAPCLV